MAEGETIRMRDLPDHLRAWFRGGEEAQPNVPGAAGRPALIDAQALRNAIRASDPIAAGSACEPYHNPAHVDFAKRAWMRVLIEEFYGDLSLIARYWDRSAEKTVRKLVHAYALGDELQAARRRKPRPA